MPEGRCVAFIPARGGSRRLPRKNIRDVGGRPLIAWTIQAALDAGIFDEVIVSTDDDEIAAIATKFGAVVVRRPDSLASDEISVTEVVLAWLEQEVGEANRPERLVVMYPTAALRGASDVLATVALLEQDNCDFAIAASRYPLPPHQAMRLGTGSRVDPMWPDLIERRADEIGDLVVDNGSTYAVCTESFLVHRTFFGPDMRVHVMPFTRSIDLDDPEDLELLNALLEGSHQ